MHAYFYTYNFRLEALKKVGYNYHGIFHCYLKAYTKQITIKVTSNTRVAWFLFLGKSWHNIPNADLAGIFDCLLCMYMKTTTQRIDKATSRVIVLRSC